MLRHGGIAGIGQTQFLQADAALAPRLVGDGALREEAVDQHALDFLARQLALDRAGDDLAAAAQHRHRRAGQARIAEERSLAARQLCHSISICPASSLMLRAANDWAIAWASARSMLSPPSRM